MSILGANLDDLDRLSQQLHTTSTSIDTISGDTRTSVTDVVDRMRQAGTTAVSSATAHMDALQTAVDQAQSQADSASWVGQNAEVFRSAYHEFNAAMAKAGEATRHYFSELHTLLERLGGETEQYLTELTASLHSAQQSTDSMAQAVSAQRENLDQVMNTGLHTVG